MRLKELTNQLEKTLEALRVRYLENEKPEDKKDKLFFQFVKLETTPIFQLIEDWEKEALHFIKDRNVKVHPQQVASTKENMDLLLMHSYYIDVRRKRYMELNQSVKYVFDLLLDDINQR